MVQQRPRDGFTLVELSIVLVILGLLVGGVLTGQSLIRAAELRSVSTEYTRYTSAVHTFRDKYFALPGDMTNATKYWGEAASGAACVSTDMPPATCDGNGNGVIDMAYANSDEVFRFWQQLANAGLIEGGYPGIPFNITGDSPMYDNAKTGYNTPRSKISSSAMWYVESGAGSFDGNSAYFASQNNNIMQLGAGPGSGCCRPTVGVLKPEEAYNIDTKMDDGKPGTGKVKGNGWADCAVATSRTDVNATYNLTDTTLSCKLVFGGAF